MIFRIKKLDIFILKQFGLLFVGTFFICQFVLMMQFLWRYIDTLIGKGLSMDVLAQFFWYMGLMLVPQAFPLALLLSSLITFGNLSESSELTAIKAAGISLMQAFRSLIVVSILMFFMSLYFQNTVGPQANKQVNLMLISMKQKSPELEIPEGIFYDGIPNSNLYVQKKDMETGKLYGIMIYRMTGSYEDQAIILADSGMLQATAEKKHLLLTLQSGEWFENMKSQELAGGASVPYRRESFVSKKILLDYDGDFNMQDATRMSNDSRGKSFSQTLHDLDSLNHQYDSIGRIFFVDERARVLPISSVNRHDSLLARKQSKNLTFNLDTAYNRLTPAERQRVIGMALSKAQQHVNDLDFKGMITNDGDRIIRQHKVEGICRKVMAALTCIVFFFIGAPLGTIIRKGGLGIPILVSVIVFIVYYILDNSGSRMATGGMWNLWFGVSLAPLVLVPMAVFFTYKASNDSMVFNADFYRNFFIRLFGLRQRRHIFRKEVIIEDPVYTQDAERMQTILDDVDTYARHHHLKRLPNWINVFFRYEPDHEIERISEEMDLVVEDLSNTRDRVILHEINSLPILVTKAHTRPFERRWLNIVAAIIVPVGLVLYLRMWRFRLRLWRDLRTIRQSGGNIIKRIQEMETARG